MEGYMSTVSHGNTRRAFLKGTAATLTVPLLLTSRKSTAQTTPPVVPPSPPTTPWQEFLDNAITPLQPVSSLTPYPTIEANTTAQPAEAGRADHQRYDELVRKLGRPDVYEMTAMERPDWQFNPAYPPQPIWGFAGHSDSGRSLATTPGPTLFAHYGRPILCRIHNQL